MNSASNSSPIHFSSHDLIRFMKMGGDKWLYQLITQGHELRLGHDQSTITLDIGEAILRMKQEQARPAQ